MFDIQSSRTIKDREFWAVDLYEAVVNAHCIKGRHAVLNSRDTYVSLLQNGATLCIADVFGNCFDSGLSFQVDALDFIAGVFRCGIERHSEIQTCVQSLTKERETATKRFLLFCIHLYCVA